MKSRQITARYNVFTKPTAHLGAIHLEQNLDPRINLSKTLYSPDFEHDACGVAFVVNIKGVRSNQIIKMGLTALANLEHRGASGAEPDTGDGAGILIQIPDSFFREVVDFDLPRVGRYATGQIFFPKETDPSVVKDQLAKLAASEDLTIIGWREVPIDNSSLGAGALMAEPHIEQIFITGAAMELEGIDLERSAFVFRKRAEHSIEDIYFPSLSTRTFVYKGMLTTPQVSEYFVDLRDPRLESALALVHSRFSTNTFPSWSLAHPYRMIAHNGEINTLKGNRNWMRARESLLQSDLFGDDLSRIFPIATPGASDSASFDEVLELLNLGGRSLPHAVLMMIPEAWENHKTMDPAKRAFYAYHSCLMEPWDGPASIAFTDGSVVGAVLDRNGLRPSRYWVTNNDLVIMASEVGVLDINPGSIIQKGRLQPGKMFLVDTVRGRIISDEEIKSELASQHPYQKWLDENLVKLDDLPPRHMLVPQHSRIVTHQRLFGYTNEELRILIAPMAKNGLEAVGSMGSDTPIAVLSDRPRMLYDYFTQLFAQVTNPPLDAIREELVTSLSGTVGPEANLLEPTPRSVHQISLKYPIIDNDELAKLMYIDEEGGAEGFSTKVIDGLYEVSGGGAAMERSLAAIREEVTQAINDGANIFILSDRHADKDLAPIPALLLTSAVHHHLIRTKRRTAVALIVETGEAREVHHMALLIGFGAAAINPYLAFDSIVDMIREGTLSDISPHRATHNYIKAAAKGVLKVMSKMGISTVASYTGAQVFEAIGLSSAFIKEYFEGTPSRIEGIGIEEVAKEVAARHHVAYLDREAELAYRDLPIGGEYQWRREGEYHLFNPETVFKLQHATRNKRFDIFSDYSRLIDDQSRHLATIRGLLKFKTGARPPVDIDEVEPISEIVKRFSTGAMSYGSISKEAHETLAIAMNRLGGKSNTGEGGEDSDRYTPDANGDSRKSAIKQVASGRFGVTSEYLASATDIQIKMAQGAKPGEGGQLPGDKVYPWIAKTRNSTAGVGLISPPPHHDIYSIEDLAQLIYDLKNANPKARIHVKLVAEVGVGTVAAGVAKAHSDVVLISGHDGGTGASPLTSLKHAGIPWEIGLAETQQTLIANGLRDRIVVQVDGQLKTGRDVVIAALLGAEEFGFASAPLVVSGCIMMRVCHLDTCPVGIATQNPQLREKFTGTPEFVVTFFEYIAQQVRSYLSELGFRTIDEAIGMVELLDSTDAINHWKAQGLDLEPILNTDHLASNPPRKNSIKQNHNLDLALDNQLIEISEPALTNKTPVKATFKIKNVNRSVGTMLGYELTSKFAAEGLPDGTIDLTFNGSAGQSFGAFVPKGVSLTLIGDANDYVGKGLSGGRIVVRPDPCAIFVAEENIIAGNVILYGATSGKVFLRGIVGERFGVRNSGAIAVVEGIGDHGCEYMTGGKVVVIGPTGRNFGAGMSGGEAFVWDPNRKFSELVNTELVDLDPLEDEDRLWLRNILAEHLDATESNRARFILEHFNQEVEKFIKVFPRDYKAAVLAKRRELAQTKRI
ncbi:glutamate synthase large subunit [Acidithrix sp. C25]|uniref:glutamate synthase large subunit n=1 Tax=Acidithrix sp. C25 TaxID=1671482 RepID=UPI00191BAC0C|nr:glutamate synthase large subunit [Acidithrix sp. C25]